VRTREEAVAAEEENAELSWPCPRPTGHWPGLSRRFPFAVVEWSRLIRVSLRSQPTLGNHSLAEL
jgi:hypothetical protein